MKTLIKLLTVLTAVFLIAGCWRNDLRTETFHVEKMRTPEDVEKIAKSLQTVAGVKDINPDFENGTLTVVFDGLTCYIKNIEYAIVQAGYGLPNRPVPLKQ